MDWPTRFVIIISKGTIRIHVIHILMVKYLIIVAISFMLVSCQATNTRAKIVKIPIIICPVPEYTIEPTLPIEALTSDDKGDWEKIAKSYAVTIVKLQAYSKDLKEKLEVYRSGNGEVIDGITNK